MNINNKLNKKLLLINCSLPFNGSIFLLNQLKNYLNIIQIKTEFLNNEDFNKDNFNDIFFQNDYKELKYLIENNNIVIYNNYDLLLFKNRNILDNVLKQKYLKIIYIQNFQNNSIIEHYKSIYKKKNLIKDIFFYYKIQYEQIINNNINIINNQLKINNTSGYFESIITGFLQNFKFNYNNNNIYLISQNSNNFNFDLPYNTKIITHYNNQKLFKDNKNIIYTELLEDIEDFNIINNDLIILFQSLILNIININYPLYIISNKNILKLLYYYLNYNKLKDINLINIKDNILYTFTPNYYNYDILLTEII